jgi:hypothetical protein
MKPAGNPEQQQVVDTNWGDGESTLGGVLDECMKNVNFWMIHCRQLMKNG